MSQPQQPGQHGPPQPYGQQPPYGWQVPQSPYPPAGPMPYGYPMPMPTPHPQSGLALTLAIVGIFLTPVGIAAFFVGRKVRREIDREPGRYLGRENATFAWVVGIVMIALWAVMAVFIVVMLILSQSGALD